MSILPPKQYIIDNKYLSDYKQSPYDICYLVVLFSTISNFLARQKNCNIQVSLWKFMNCFEKYITNELSDNPELTTIGENFINGKKCNIVLEASNSALLEFHIDNFILFDIDKNIELNNLDKILLSVLNSSTNEDFFIDEVYFFTNDWIDYNEGEILSKNDYDKEIGPGYEDSWTKGKLKITNIRNVVLSFKEVLEKLLAYSSADDDLFFSIKTTKDLENNFDFYTASFIQKLLSLVGFPLQVICSNFLNNSETQIDINNTPNNCFKTDDCTINIKLRKYKYKEGMEILKKIQDFDTMKILLSNNKSIIWHIHPFMSDMLMTVDKCNRVINSYRQDGNDEYNVENYINSINSNANNIKLKQDCPETIKYFKLIEQYLKLIFKNKPTVNTSSFKYLNLTKFSYLYDASEKLIINCGGLVFPIGSSHVAVIYGYNQIDDNTIELYVKNSWGGNDGTSNDFIVRVRNDLILNDFSIYGKFGTLFYLSDDDINVTYPDKDICNCCFVTPTSTVTSTPTATPTSTPTSTPTVTPTATTNDNSSSSSSDFNLTPTPSNTLSNIFTTIF